MKQGTKLKSLTVTAVMSAIGYVLMLLEFPLPFIIPGFIKFDFSELPALLTSFAVGPLYGVAVCLVKNLLHLLNSHSAGVGELANFLLGAVFVFTAGMVYKHKKSRKTALIGSLVGAVIMGLISVPVNYFVVYPFYMKFMPLDAIIEAYKLLLPAADTLLKALLIFNLPFTVAKGLITAVICFVIYKRISPILR